MAMANGQSENMQTMQPKDAMIFFMGTPARLKVIVVRGKMWRHADAWDAEKQQRLWETELGMPELRPRLLRQSNFRYYMIVRVLTTTATEMQAVAVAWQVYALTHRPLDLGLVGMAQFLPGILLFLVTGQTADRFARQRILQVCCGGFALCSLLLLGLTWRGMASIFPIYGVLLLNGTVRAFNGPAGQAFLPLLVTEEAFPKAVAWNSSIFQAATIAGPVVGGLLVWLDRQPRAGL